MKRKNMTIKQDNFKVEHLDVEYDVTIAFRWIDGAIRAFRRVILIVDPFGNYLYTNGVKGRNVVNGEKIKPREGLSLFREINEDKRESGAIWWKMGDVFEKVARSNIGWEYLHMVQTVNPTFKLIITSETVNSFSFRTSVTEDVYSYLTYMDILTDDETKEFRALSDTVTRIMVRALDLHATAASNHIQQKYGVAWSLPENE